MTYRCQISACGWNAVLKHDNGTYSLIPLVCFEILCADEKDEEEFVHYEPEMSYHVKGEPYDRAIPKRGSAIEAVGLVFFDTHPQKKPTLALSVIHMTEGFMGYLPPGQRLEDWLNHKDPREEVDISED